MSRTKYIYKKKGAQRTEPTEFPRSATIEESVFFTSTKLMGINCIWKCIWRDAVVIFGW
jgi:hypothetical protein